MNDNKLAERIAEEILKNKPIDDKGNINKIAIEKPIKKEAKAPQPLVKPKQYFDVKVEAMIPATLTYRILAEDPVQATELIKGMVPTGVKHRLVGRKDLKIMVYDAGSSMLKWVKNLI